MLHIRRHSGEHFVGGGRRFEPSKFQIVGWTPPVWSWTMTRAASDGSDGGGTSNPMIQRRWVSCAHSDTAARRLVCIWRVLSSWRGL
jgi:hypothetical protein